MIKIFTYLYCFCILIGFMNACKPNQSKNSAQKALDTNVIQADRSNTDTLNEVEKIPGLHKIEDLMLFEGNEKIYYSIEEAILEPLQVKKLRLISQRIYQLPAQIVQFSNLEELYLSDNFLVKLPDSFATKLPKLQVLDLSNNRFQIFPKTINQLENLELLNIANNQINLLSKDFVNLKKLQILDMQNNKFANIPTEIFALQSLKYLHIKGIPLLNIPNDLLKLRQLSRLTLANCQLKTFPNVLFQMPNLERLILSENQIQAIPTEIKDLSNLIYLNVSQNKLNTEINALLKLKKLLHLDLSYNPLQTLPSELFTELRNIKALNLAHTQLSEISINIGKLQELVWLAVNGTKIKELPASLSDCKRLQQLYLGKNPELNLAETFLQLSTLRKLNTLTLINIKGTNQFITLPQEIVQLKGLKKLDLKQNRFSNLPAELIKLGQLGRLEALNLSLCGIQKANNELENLQTLRLLGLDIQNMSRQEIQKLPNLLSPNTQIIDGSDSFEYR